MKKESIPACAFFSRVHLFDFDSGCVGSRGAELGKEPHARIVLFSLGTEL
jgi:hypothetical protein